MSNTNDGGPAFPFQATILDVKNGNSRAEFPGLSIRDYFAAAVVSGLCANKMFKNWENEHVAGIAFAIADAMIDEMESK